MSPEQALQILKNAAAEFRGTATDHKLIEEASQILLKYVSDNQSGAIVAPDELV